MSTSLPLKTTRLLGVVVFLLIVPPFLKYAWWETWEYVGGDFEIFLGAAKNLSEGISPYPSAVLYKAPGQAMGEAWGNYIYPPLFARLLLPFSYLPPMWGKKAYLTVCLILYLVMLWPTRQRGYRYTVQKWAAFTILLGWGPVIHTFRHGQSDFIPLYLIILAWWVLGGGRETPDCLTPDESLTRRKFTQWYEFGAGVLLGAASMVKITPILLLPAFLVGMWWRLSVGFVTGAFLALFISGPVTSWQYFTQVLPNMADFAGMRQCPSIHIVLVRAFDGLPVPHLWREWWPMFPELTGVAITGVLFAWVLWYLFKRRNQISTPDYLLLTCFLPPLFAGEVKHHYALAILPVLEAFRRLLPLCCLETFPKVGFWRSLKGQSPPGHPAWAVWRRDTPYTHRFLALCVCLIPNFYYWAIFTQPLEWLCPIDPATLLVVGNIGVAILVQPLFIRSGFSGSENQSGIPPQA